MAVPVGAVPDLPDPPRLTNPPSQEAAASSASEDGEDPGPNPEGSLHHLAYPFSRGSHATPALEAQLTARALSPEEVDNYNVEGAKKRIIVRTLDALEAFMRSPHVRLIDKVTKGLDAMGQWEGTRRIIEWDKRKPQDKDLLERGEKIAQRLMDIRKRMSPAQVAQAQLQAAEILLGDFGTAPEKQKSSVVTKALTPPSTPSPTPERGDTDGNSSDQ